MHFYRSEKKSRKSLSRGVTVLIMSAVLSQVTVPRPARAFLTLGTGGGALAAVVILGAGSGSLMAGNVVAGKERSRPALSEKPGFGLKLAGILGIMAGIVVLDDTGAPTPRFRELGPELAASAGLTPTQRRAFNRDRHRLNAVAESIAHELAAAGPIGLEQALGISRARWREARQANVIRTDEAFQALEAVSAYLRTKSPRA